MILIYVETRNLMFLYSVMILQSNGITKSVLMLAKNKEHVHTCVLSHIMHILKCIAK